LVAGLAARYALPARAMQLAWHGGAWQLRLPGSDACSGQAALMLDLGPLDALRFSPAGLGRWGAIWLPLSRRDAAAAWPTLRAALHAPRPAA
jgi:hypothetical protein